MHAPLSHARALAARRAAIATAALGSAIVAHVVSMGSWDVLPIAPAVWAMAIAAVALIGARRSVFRKRNIAVTALLVLAGQFTCHLGMTAAPWAFGLRLHHEMPMITPGAAVAHVVAGVALTAVVLWLECILLGATRALRAVIALVVGTTAVRPRPRRSAPRRAVRPSRARPPRTVFLRVSPSRGPPLAA